MQLPSFALDKWIEQKHTANPPIEFDLASSTGPVWTLRELLDLDTNAPMERLLDTRLSYTAAAGTPELRAAIAEMHGVEPSDVQVVTGAAEALLILFFLAAEPGANVMLPYPGFPANAALATAFGVEVRYYAIEAENGFRIDIDNLCRRIDNKTTMVLVNSPHNPTGSVMSDEELKFLHDFCAQREVPFVSDEVYHPIYHGHPAQAAARLPHATVIGDFSKALCLSGLRTGWIIERDGKRRERFHNARNHFTITSPVISERLAVVALQNRAAIYERAQKIASDNLAELDRVLTEHAGRIRWIKPAGGMTAYPWLADGTNARPFCTRLMRHGVLVVPGDCFGQPSHFRLGFAASGERFPQAMERFADFLDTERR